MTTWKTDPSTPVDELWARFVTEVSSELDESTVSLWELYGRTHIAPYFTTLGEISTASCAQYGRARLAKVKRATVQKELSTLRRFLAWAAEQGYVEDPPVVPQLARRATGTPYEKRRRGAATELDADEVRAVIDALPDWSESRKIGRFPVRARFVVAFETSLRPATLDGLSVPEHYHRGANELRIPAELDKTAYDRVVPLSDDACAALDAVCPDSGLIFGEHDYRDQLTKAATAALDEHKAKTFTGYDLRHARLTQLAETGNLTGAAYIAGHKRVTTTAIYIKPGRKAAERALAAVGSTGLTIRKLSPRYRRGALAGVPIPQKSKQCEGEDLNLHGSYPASTSS